MEGVRKDGPFESGSDPQIHIAATPVAWSGETEEDGCRCPMSVQRGNVTPMKWTLYPAQTAFESHRALWDDLNRRSSDSALLESRFVASLLRWTGSKKVFLAVHVDETRPALALLERRRFGAWQTFQPSQAPVGLILLSEGTDPAELLGSLVRSLPGFALECTILQQDPSISAFGSVPESEFVSIQKYIDTARVTIQGTFQDYWAGRGREVVENVTKKIRRLERNGIRSELRVVRDPAEIEVAIREYGRLESTGWKGKAGTAVEGDNKQGHFYRDVLLDYCQDGHGAVYQLRFNGRIVASKLTVDRNGTIVFLKTAYDEEFRSDSPGYLLQYEMFKRIFERGEFQSVEFYGRLLVGWTDRWSGDVRSMFHVTYYRHPWVRLALALLKSVRGAKGRGDPSEAAPHH